MMTDSWGDDDTTCFRHRQRVLCVLAGRRMRPEGCMTFLFPSPSCWLTLGRGALRCFHFAKNLVACCHFH